MGASKRAWALLSERGRIGLTCHGDNVLGRHVVKFLLLFAVSHFLSCDAMRKEANVEAVCCVYDRTGS